MRYLSLRYYLPIFLLLLAIVGCGSSKKAARLRSELPPRQALTSAEQLLFNSLYHEALICYESGEYDAHKVLLERALEIDSTAAEALWMLARVEYASAAYDDTLQRQNALKLMRSAAYYCPYDVDIQKYLAMMLDDEGLNDEALECYKQIVEIHPTKASQLELAGSYMGLGKFSEALGVYNQIERQKGLIREVIEGKLQAYTELGDSLLLFSFIDTLICEYPNEYDYQVIKGMSYESLYNRPDLAVFIYNNVLEQSPSNVRAQYALLTHYGEQEDSENVFQSIKRILSNEHIEETSRAKLLYSAIQDYEESDSLKLYDLKELMDSLSQSDNSTGALSATHIILLSALNAPPDSILPVVHRTLKFIPENSAVRMEGIRLYYLSGDLEGMVALCEEGQYYDPQMVEFYYYPADVAISLGSYDYAIETLERGEPYFMKSENDTLSAHIFALMGDLYQLKGNMERCYAVYDSALVLVPDNPSVLNNYAYFLSLDGRDLDKAATMAHRANELEPNNPTYLDTYAWVLYQNGQYTQARIYIDQALAALTEENESSVYYEHAGDIYWKLGERTRARQFRARAKQLKRFEDK